MTITATSSRMDPPYVGNGAATEFNIDFPFRDDTHIRAILVRSGLADADLVLDTDFTLTGAGSAEGGKLTFPAVGSAYGILADGETLHILRVAPLTQERDWDNVDALDAEEIEAGDDRLTMICQQLQEQLDRAVRWPATATGETDAAAWLSSAQTARDQAQAAGAAAEAAQVTAESAQDSAESARDAALTAQSGAQTARTGAEQAATAAAASAGSASASAASATGSASTAATAASNAAASQSAAQSSATSAAGSASGASASAGSAATSAGNAAGSATAAASSASAAAAAAAEAQALAGAEHNALTARDAADCHPQSAVTGLAAALAAKLGTTAQADLNLNGYDVKNWGTQSLGASADLNTVKATGYYDGLGSATANIPAGMTGYFQLVVFGVGANHLTQLFITVSGFMFVRQNTWDTWGAWRDLVTGATGKAADSAKLDGYVQNTAIVADTVVRRNGSGDVYANVFWGSLSGTAGSARYA